jgi:hypothetical protein
MKVERIKYKKKKKEKRKKKPKCEALTIFGIC